MNPDIVFEAGIRMPRLGKVHRLEFRIDPALLDDCYKPLPRDRELSFAVESRIEAARMRKMRRDISNSIAEQMADKLVELLEKEDPQFGYSPEQWREIQQFQSSPSS